MKMSSQDIDVVRTMMSLVDKSCLQQDPDTEIARKCISDIIDNVSNTSCKFSLNYVCLIDNIKSVSRLEMYVYNGELKYVFFRK